MDTRKSIRIGISLTAAAVALLSAARPALGQTAPIRYVFGANSSTDSKGQVWAPVPTSYLSDSARWHWSNCAKDAVFTGTPNPDIYKQQIAEDSGDMVLTVPVPNGSYIVNLYFAEPCSFYAAGMRVFGVVLNGTTIASSLDLEAMAGGEKPVIEFAPVNGYQIVLDLKRITNDPVIAAIEILPATSFQLAARLKWDDGTPVAGQVAVAQETSTDPPASQSLGSFVLDSNGAAAGSLTPDLALPLNFSFTLINPAGAIVNTLKFSCDLLTLKVFPHTLSPLIVLNKSSATLESFSF